MLRVALGASQNWPYPYLQTTVILDMIQPPTTHFLLAATLEDLLACN